MKIEKYYDKRERKEMYRARFQLGNREFTPRADTRRRLLEMIDEIRARRHREKFDLPTRRPEVLVKTLIDAKIKKLDLKKKDDRRRRVVLTEFVEFLGEDYPLSKLDTVDIQNWAENFAHLKPWSQLKYIGMVSACLNEAPLLLKECSGYRPPRIKWLKAPRKGSGRVITAQERKMLLEALREPKPQVIAGIKNVPRKEQPRDVFVRHELADMFEIALHTGMRWGEICRLEWRFLHARERRLYLPKEITKTDEARNVYLNQRVYEILSARRLKARTRWIFPNTEETNYRKYYSKPLRTVAKRLGLDYGQEIEGGFTPHSTRHTATTLLLQNNDLETVRELVGHSKSTMTLVYSHTKESLKRRAVEGLENVLFSEEVGEMPEQKNLKQDKDNK